MDTIITKRPENMSFEDYVKARSEQTKRERSRKKHGVLVYVASQIVYEPILIKDEISPTIEADERTDKVETAPMKRTFQPAIKTYDEHGNVKYVPMRRIEL